MVEQEVETTALAVVGLSEEEVAQAKAEQKEHERGRRAHKRAASVAPEPMDEAAAVPARMPLDTPARGAAPAPAAPAAL